MKISASLVLFRSPQDQFETVIRNFIDAAPAGILHVVDNSPEPLSSEWFSHARVVYHHSGANLGFGAAHNVAFKIACAESDLHFLLNPDIHFGADVVDGMVNLLVRHPEAVVAMPRVVYPDGSLQRLCKLLPTPVDLLVRRFMPLARIRQKIDARYELHALPQDRVSEVPTLSGCFLVARSHVLLELNGFDERYFMYMEDVDLVRRLGEHGSVLYAPHCSVVHEYAKGSYRNRRLLGYHLRSAIHYFNKWGWLFDSDRVRRNRACLNSINEPELIDCGDLKSAK